MMDWPVALRADMLWTLLWNESTFCCSALDVFGPAKKSTTRIWRSNPENYWVPPPSHPSCFFSCAERPNPKHSPILNCKQPFDMAVPNYYLQGFGNSPCKLRSQPKKELDFLWTWLAMTILSCSVAASPKLIPAHARVLDSPTHSMESLWRGVCLIVMLCSIFCANTTQAPHPAALQWILQSTQRCSNLKQSSSIAAAIPIGPG